MYSDLLLYQAARRIQTNYHAYFRTIGLSDLTFTQYITLRELWNTPTNCLSEKELCKLLGLDSGTLTPVLKKLEATGLVTRVRRKDDERVVEITLTEEGRAVRGKIGAGPEIGLTDEQVEVLEQIMTEQDDSHSQS